MMRFRSRTKALTAVAACVVLGAIGGIAGSAASSNHRSSSSSSTPRKSGFARGAIGGPLGRGGAVHASEIVLDKAGTAFITRTIDSGTVKSVSGNDVTITEGVGSVTYKDVTLTIPSGATVTRDGASASVSDLKAGDRISVSRSSDGTSVFAADSAWRPSGMNGHGGPGGGGWGGAPPGAPSGY
jgi:hypothetical protein